MSRINTQMVLSAKNDTKKAFEEVRKDIDLLDKRMAQAGQAVVGYLSIQTFAGAIRTIANTSDAWVEMTDRIKLATRSDEEYADSLEALRTISDRTFTNMTNNAEVYINSLSVLRERGFSNREALQFTETIGLGLVASAAKGERATQVINQFSKALQQGKLQGDSFNAMVESAPALTDALARGLGKTREELARMATEGKLTTDVFVPALLSQMDSLGSAVDGMTITVGDALTRLQNAWNSAIGGADVTPLVNAIQGLTEVISDPVVVDNLVALASALVSLAATAAEGGSEFVDLGKRIGFVAASATGSITELDKIDQQIKDIDRSINGTGLNTTLSGLWYSKEELQAQKQALVALRALIAGTQEGITEDQRQAEVQRRQEAKVTTDQLKEQYKSVSKEAKQRISEITAAEREANSEVERLRKERLDIDKRYNDLRAKIAGAGSGDPSYGQANQLKVAARDALRNGDLETARSNAQAAAKILEDLAAAGENTYGFDGFISELQAIEAQANAIEKTAADQKLATLSALLKDLKDQANIKITADLSPEEIAKVQQQIQALATDLSAKFVITPTITLGNVSSTDPAATVPGFATGTNSAPPGMAWVGENGPELVNFRGGEQVLTAAASRNLASRMQGLVMGDPASGAAEAAVAQQAVPTYGSWNINLGGEQVSVMVEQGNAPNMRRLAAKFGGSSRRK